jgi:hypothetical protein
MHTRAHARLHLQSQWGKNNQKKKKDTLIRAVGAKRKEGKCWLSYLTKNIVVESIMKFFWKTLWKLLQSLIATFCLPKRLSSECLLLDKEQQEHMLCK